MLMMSAADVVASDMTTTKAWSMPVAPTAHDWSGFYVGGHVGYAAMSSYWNSEALGAPTLSGSTEIFDDDGPWGPIFGGLQAGYNYVLASQLLAGVEADVSFPNHLSATRQLSSAAEGQFSVADTVEFFATARARVGLAANNWLVYATGGFAFDRELMTRSQIAGVPIAGTAMLGDEDQQLVTRLGWTIGLGIELRLSRNWGVKLDYLFMDYGSKGVVFPLGSDRYNSDLTVQTLRAGLNYHFGSASAPSMTINNAVPDMINWSIHGQTTWIGQGYPGFAAAYSGAQSLFPGGEVRNTVSGTGFIGLGLWNGAALYYNPELLQGLGLSGLHGVAGFPNGEAQKANILYPHYNTSRLYYQQVFGFGGEQETIDDEPNQIAQKVDVSRFTFTIGKMSVPDFFDDNAYAHESRTDFMNYAIIDSGAFDYAADQFDYTWGIVGELNQKTWAVRGGYFLVPTVQEGNDYDTNFFRRGQYIIEAEDRYFLFSQPGKIRIGAWLSSAFAGSFAAALAQPGINIDATRHGRIEYGFYANLEQALSGDFGLFARLSWRNGQTEIMSFTDIDRSLSLGAVLKGTSWGRPDDQVGVAGAINGLSAEYRAFLAAGGLGDIIGDGALNYREEKILETYYAYRLDRWSTFTVDYQFVADPAYNADRGPVHIFTGRFHSQF
ncbi:MAG: carbohydrate porin [Xanthobacteraceae bacterium]